MHESTFMTKEKEGVKSELNNLDDPQINRGFELMLRHNSRREKSSKPKSFQIHFGKMLSLFKREIHFQIDFLFGMKKK